MSIHRRVSGTTLGVNIQNLKTQIASYTNCTLNFLPVNTDGSCWIDSVVVSLFYPSECRQVMRHLSDGLGDNEFQKHVETIARIFEADAYAAPQLCPRESVSRTLVQRLNQLNETRQPLPESGGGFSQNVFEALYHAFPNTLHMFGGSLDNYAFDAWYMHADNACHHIENSVLNYQGDIGDNVEVVFVTTENLHLDRYKKGTTSDGRALVFEPEISTFHHFHSIVDTKNNQYVLRSVVINMPRHAVCLASCSPSSYDMEDTSWIFYTGQDGYMRTVGKYETFPREMLTHAPGGSSRFNITYGGRPVNAWTAESACLVFVKRKIVT